MSGAVWWWTPLLADWFNNNGMAVKLKTCRICLKGKQTIAYDAAPVDICQDCIDKLNLAPEPAKYSEQRIGELLRTGMRNRNPNFTESEYLRALPGWINRLLADKSNNRRDFINVRAYRRGLLRYDGSRQWSYPADWIDRARRIRSRDQCCQNCGGINIPLDVHHIIYLSNYGTNQDKNLIALCRPCHEEVHGREFDFGEPEEPGNPSPIKPAPHHNPPDLRGDVKPPPSTGVTDITEESTPPAEAMTPPAAQGATQTAPPVPVPREEQKPTTHQPSTISQDVATIKSPPNNSGAKNNKKPNDSYIIITSIFYSLLIIILLFIFVGIMFAIFA